MEHLGESFGSLDGLNKIPLYADPSTPTIGNFHTFHNGDNGYIIYDDERRFAPTRHLPESDLLQSTRHSLTKFVQRWLYFEVLRAILGHLPGFNVLHFTRTGSEGDAWVTTEKLPNYLTDWLDFEIKDSAHSKSRLLHRQYVLDRARHFVLKNCAVRNTSMGVEWPIDEEVALSIMVLGETLTTAMIKVQQATDFYLRGWCNHDYRSQGWGYSQAVLEALQRRHWCPNKLAILQGMLGNNTIGLLYALQIPPTGKPEESHHRCTASECRPLFANPVGLGQISPPESPRCDHCRQMNCPAIGPDTKKLNRIIKDGKIPLLRYSKDAQEVELMEMSAACDKEYVIFSHVWADGYGNPNANQLPKCVLDLFLRLFRDIKNENSYGRNRGTLQSTENFWIDTLAIPVDDKYKAQRKKAIRNMHKIYTGAKYTIVLDAGLMRINRGEGYIQPAMSITLSGWMTRLWTLQEAVLSKQLYFNFSDQVYAMERLEKLYKQENAPLHSCAAYVSRTYYHGILEKESQKMHANDLAPADKATSQEFVAAVWKAVQWRRTAHLQHETLALATLLDVDTDEFADSSNTKGTLGYDGAELDRRMQKLLDLLSARKPCPIPPGIIFLPGPRLKAKGYGWAPRTWLSRCPVEPPDPLVLNDNKARLNTPHGLEVWFPGFRLHELGTQNDPGTPLSTFTFSPDNSLSLWYHVCPADEGGYQMTRERRNSRELAIIAPQLMFTNGTEIALLVAIAREQDGIFFVEILRRVWISIERDLEKTKRWRSDFENAKYDSIFSGERLPPEQHWCVDRRQDSQPTHPINHHEFDEDDEEGPKPGFLKKATTNFQRLLGSPEGRSKTWK